MCPSCQKAGHRPASQANVLLAPEPASLYSPDSAPPQIKTRIMSATPESSLDDASERITDPVFYHEFIQDSLS